MRKRGERERERKKGEKKTNGGDVAFFGWRPDWVSLQVKCHLVRKGIKMTSCLGKGGVRGSILKRGIFLCFAKLWIAFFCSYLIDWGKKKKGKFL